MEKLPKREQVALADIAKHRKSARHGYSKWWTPKTNEKLEKKGLVEFVGDRVYITDEGLDVVNSPA